MEHKNCGGSVVLDLTDCFIITSPSMVVTTKGISSGMLQIDSSGNKKPAKFICLKCKEILDLKNKLDDEIIERCVACSREFHPSDILVTDIVPFLCKECAKGEGKNIDTSASFLSLYGAFLKKVSEFPTLLQVLSKKL